MRTILAMRLVVALFSAAAATASCHAAPRVWPVACEDCASNEAVLIVRLPEDARLFVNGRETAGTGGVRHLIDRNMLEGRSYRYRLRAELTVGDKTVEADRVVCLLAGESLELTLAFDHESLQGHPTPAEDAQDGQPDNDAAEQPDDDDGTADDGTADVPVTTIILHVPENAKVFLEGVETESTGAVREFNTTQLSAGRQWTDYTIRVVAERDGRMVSMEKKINVTAGQTHELRFDLDDGRWEKPLDRDPAVREDVLRREGGSATTEAAVAAGLAWIVKNQNDDGSWSLHLFGDPPTARDPDGRQRAREISESAATALALLPLLGAGHTHVDGPYREAIDRGLAWLIAHQGEDGCLRAGSNDKAAMYAHGQAAIVLCEALAMTGDEKLREPAQKAIDFIVDAQNIWGGWRYRPREPGDLSVTGWQTMALKSAQAAGLRVPPMTLKKVGKFLSRVESSGGAQYAYMENRRPTHVMTAEGLLCRIYLGWKADHPALLRGADSLIENHPPSAKTPNIYYWYYATPVMHFIGGERWKTWNEAMSRLLIEMQDTPDGENPEHAGSWAPQGGRSTEGGRLYMTALALCTLEAYYRTVLPRAEPEKTPETEQPQQPDLRWGQPHEPEMENDLNLPKLPAENEPTPDDLDLDALMPPTEEADGLTPEPAE